MRHTITIDENEIAHVKIIGDGDVNVAREFVTAAEKLFKQHPGKNFCGIVDMLESGTSDYDGIKIYREFLKNKRLRKVAFVITNPVIKAFVKIATEFKKDVEFFETTKEAEDWIVSNCL